MRKGKVAYKGYTHKKMYTTKSGKEQYPNPQLVACLNYAYGSGYDGAKTA
jgi:hypothetical protein